MIVGMLPYLQWKFGPDKKKKGHIAKWFKLAAHAHAVDAYWDPKEECIKNTSNTMLTVAMVEDDSLYWAAENHFRIRHHRRENESNWRKNHLRISSVEVQIP